MVTLISRPVDPTRKRFYLVQTDFRRPITDMTELNLDDFKGPGWMGRNIVRHFVEKGADGYDRYLGGGFGWPEITVQPKIEVGLSSKLVDVYEISGRLYISGRAKRLLESIDGEAFDFIECNTITRHHHPVESYWLADVNRVVSKFDTDRSVFQEAWGDNIRPIPLNAVRRLSMIYELAMNDDLPNAYHAFYLLHYMTYFIFDEVIVDTWRKGKLNGLVFSPLQPPTKKELEDSGAYLYSNNYYFWEESRHEWEHLVPSCLGRVDKRLQGNGDKGRQG